MHEKLASLKVVAEHHLKRAVEAEQQAQALLAAGLVGMAEVWSGMYDLHKSVYEEFLEMIHEEEAKVSDYANT